jgi:peptide/nickel transport system ATP-binding protein
MSVALHNLTVRFATPKGPVDGLRNLSLGIGAGRILGLVGESGSGKSTAALALLGLLASNATVVSGRLALGGQDFDLSRPDATSALRGRGIAMVFQDPFTALNPVFTVRAHLAEAVSRRSPDLAGRAREAAMVDALASVGFADPGTRLGLYPHQLSGGMRQRVAIAMALLAKPDLLIADEPTTALDATVEAQVMAQVLSLRDRIGCSVLLITHSLGLVAQYCDDIAVLYAGEGVESGPVARVAPAARHPYARALLACEVGIDTPLTKAARFKIIPGDLPDLAALPTGCIYAPRCPRASALCATSPGPTVFAPDHWARCHHPEATP